MSDVEILNRALTYACTELLWRTKYGGRIPENVPPLTSAELAEMSRLRDRFLDEAVEDIQRRAVTART